MAAQLRKWTLISNLRPVDFTVTVRPCCCGAIETFLLKNARLLYYTLLVSRDLSTFLKGPNKCESKTKVNKQDLKIACSNVGTRLDRAASNHPESRSALIVCKLSPLKIDIATLVRSALTMTARSRSMELATPYTGPETIKRKSFIECRTYD